MAARLTLITVCKGRLDHLRVALPSRLSLPGCEWVIVDVACPDGVGRWAAEAYPQVAVVELREDRPFSVARARNFGAARATTPWLMFIDADILLQPGFVEFLHSIDWTAGGYYRILRPRRTLTGTCLCTMRDFRLVGGYDEVLCGWGGEDIDFFAHLEAHGIRPNGIPPHLIDSIEHDDASRTRFYVLTDMRESESLHRLYVQLKHELQRLSGRKLEEPERRELYRKLTNEALPAWRDGVEATLDFPWRVEGLWNECRVTKSVRYRLSPPPRKNF